MNVLVRIYKVDFLSLQRLENTILVGTPFYFNILFLYFHVVWKTEKDRTPLFPFADAHSIAKPGPGQSQQPENSVRQSENPADWSMSKKSKPGPALWCSGESCHQCCWHLICTPVHALATLCLTHLSANGLGKALEAGSMVCMPATCAADLDPGPGFGWFIPEC